MRIYLLNILIKLIRIETQKINLVFISKKCLNRGTDPNRLSIPLSQILKNRIKIWKYVSVVACQEVLEYYETSYFGEYQFVLFEYMS